MSTIIIRNSATSGSIPSSLIQGELAINVTNNRLFYGSGSGNVVKEFTGSSGGSSGTVDTGSFVTTSSFNAYTGSNTSQFAGTASFVTGSIFTNGNRVLSASYAVTASFVPGAIGGSGTVGAIAKFSGTATIANATADTDYLINSVSTIAYTAMGSTIKGNGVAVDKPHDMSTNASLTAGSVFFIAYYLPKAETITGVKWFQGTTAAGSSGSFGLYSVSAGTITLQASSSLDSTLFSTSQNTFKSKAFTSTYAAPAGLYYIGVSNGGANGNIGNKSIFNQAVYGADFTNTNRLVSTVVTSSLPATQALSGTSATINAFGLFLY
jgi:hypothetical protein